MSSRNVTCSNCGSANNVNVTFCANCGFPLSKKRDDPVDADLSFLSYIDALLHQPLVYLAIALERQLIAVKQAQEQENHIPSGPRTSTQFKYNQILSWLIKSQTQASSPSRLPPSVMYRDIKLPVDFTNTLAFSPDGLRLAVGRVRALEKNQIHRKLCIYRVNYENDLINSISELPANLHPWSFNWNTQIDRSIQDQDNLAFIPTPAASLSWSPDGARLAFTDQDGANSIFCILKIDSNTSSVFLQESHGSKIIKWSPDGKLITLVTYDDVLQIWDVEKEIKLSSHNIYGITAVAWSPDSRLIAFACVDGATHVQEVTGREVCTYRNQRAYVVDVVWSPDGTFIVSCGEDRTIHVWEGQTARHIHLLEGHTDTVARAAFLSNGLLLASIDYRGAVFIWRTDTWLPVESFTVSSSSSLSFAPPIFHSTRAFIAIPQSPNMLGIWQLDVALFLGRPAAISGLQYTNAKVVLVGDSGVGKSGLGLVLSHQRFVPTESTHGRVVRTFSHSECDLGNGGKEIREILLWDLAGQPGYRLIHQFHLSAAAVALVVFDAHSEIDPFAGIDHWVRALRTSHRVNKNENLWELKILLIHARMDRGGKRVSGDRIGELVSSLGFDGYFETSAKEGTNIVELSEAINHAIDWDRLPKVTSTDLFQRIKKFLIKEKTWHILPTIDALYGKFCEPWEHSDELRAKFETCVRLLEATGLIRRFSFGSFVLLQPEILDAYASALINAARDDPDGLGSISEEDARTGNFSIPRDERILNNEQEKLLLIAMVEDLLSYEIALRDEAYLIFPSESTRENPSLLDSKNQSVVFTFEGSTRSIYATLAVRLSHSGFFTKQELWKNAITYRDNVGGTCGMFLHVIEDGKCELTIFFDADASKQTRFQFEEYVHIYLQRKALPKSVQRRRIFTCPICGFPASDQLVRGRLERGYDWFLCPMCGDARVDLVESNAHFKQATLSLVSAMDRAADIQRVRETAQSTIQGKEETNDFDVFLCHNTMEKPEVKEIGKALKDHGILPWLDEWELRPGLPWQRLIEKNIEHIKSAAVFVGSDGIGPWQQEELEALLREFVRRGCPVIPVLLKSAQHEPKLPVFLKGRTYVDFRSTQPDPMQQLLWGITGKRR